MNNYDFLIIGAGIFGLSTAISLAKRGHQVGLLNPGKIPHHLAASTDVTKIVRMEYGSDLEYFQMAEKSMQQWREWNDFFGEQLYHEVGFLMLCQDRLDSPRQQYEQASCQQLLAHGYPLQLLQATELQARFPTINSKTYSEGNFNPKGGYVKADRVITVLADYARSLGVQLYEGQTAHQFDVVQGQLTGIRTLEKQQFSCGHAIVAAGAHTPYLLPELQPYMKVTAHPIFWLKPDQPHLFSSPHLPVFTADISNTGWYGFPYLPEYGIIKIAKHTDGIPLHPDRDDRQISDAEVADMRQFVHNSLPALSNAPLVYSRKCLYTDTLDGHFWIDHHPEIKGLSVSTGGSGHGLKMGPVIGELTADMAQENSVQYSNRYRWRQLHQTTKQVEEARFISKKSP